MEYAKDNYLPARQQKQPLAQSSTSSIPVANAPKPPLSVPVASNAPKLPTTTTTAAAAAEDDNGGTSSIDTFQEYKPTALPCKIVRACNEWYSENTTSAANVDATIPAESNVIDLTAAINDTEPSKTSSSLPVVDSDNDEPNVTLTVTSHTSSACESALLSSVPAPLVPQETAECILPLLSRTKPGRAESSPPLSPLQLEGVLLSIERHRRIHHPPTQGDQSATKTQLQSKDAFRAGFFLGDGAGIGKGRQISGILRDSLCRGRKRHVWLSVSRELIQDAKRDLKDVGLECASDAVFDGTQFLGDSASNNKGLTGRNPTGILFLTYNLLVTANRVEQIIAWCAGTEQLSKKNSASNMEKRLDLERSFDGCIVFDEAHKAKNLADNTKTAQLVLLLQRRLPMARVVYCSATGVSDVDQLAYAERLGLWKMNSSIGYEIPDTKDHSGGQFANFAAFRRSLEQRGLGSLELLALELKTKGSLMARTLSWDGAEFVTAEVPLDSHQRLIYDRGVAWWNQCQSSLKIAVKMTKELAPPNASKSNTSQNIWGTFWAAHQRFFKELAICAKVPFLAEDALQQIENGCSVVFGLQGTGEAGMQSLLNGDDESSKTKKLHSKRRFPSLMSTVAAGLTNFVKQHFPVAPDPPEIPSLPKDPPKTELEVYQYSVIQAEIQRLKSLGPPSEIGELVHTRQVLLDAIRHMDLPPNPLDDLIERLGGAGVVAEMTGRSGRIIRVSKNEFEYKKRVVPSKNSNLHRGEESDRINILERKEFMNGNKFAAIISDAASTGISLHTAHGSKASHRRRVHYTIEFPWSADKAVQQLGRSHRSGQESAPIYKLVVTNLGGERRFAAAVSKRLASLGALTKGDRRAATGADMSDFDLDSKYGKRALKRFYRALEENDASSGQSAAAISGILSSGNESVKEIVDAFIAESTKICDPILQSFPHDDPKFRHACVLAIATAELDQVGLDRNARSKADVKMFLNRLSGLKVARQSLVFSLFMSTLGGVIKEAKSSGEFEGTAEDVTATSIEIGQEIDLAIDPSSGVSTKLTTLVLDRGISFESIHSLANEVVEKLSLISADTEFSIEMGGRDKDDKTSTEEKNDDGFIVLEDEEESKENVPQEDNGEGGDGDDEWMTRMKAVKKSTAEPGFYVSKNKIRGRHLILFAKRKFDRSNFKTEDEASAIDPLGLMLITRPNTGISLTDKSTRELRQTYRLALSCEDIRQRQTLDKSDTDNDEVKRFNNSFKKVRSLWKIAFTESDSFKHEKGLAPRRQKVLLVNGPVLHIMPALEKVVQFRSEKERALKIMRAQVGPRRIVGVRFPSASDAIEKLQAELEIINKARQNAGSTFTDEDLAPICPKTMSWATAERKKMTNYFTKVTSTTNSTGTKKSSPPISGKKRNIPFPPSSGKKSKSTTMLSYFARKK